MNPALALLAVAIVGSLGWALMAWQRRRAVERSRRHLEDALKHLFDQEYRGRHGTLSSLAGVLHLSDARVLGLVERMQAQGLLVAGGPDFDLTPEGEKLALQVVRAHRLLERYFADEARLPLARVHAAAERGEHQLSPDAANRLSAALGHPRVDPHGDPIPTRDGYVPPPAGTPISAWPEDQAARIVHLEDEPEIAYSQILAAGLAVGQIVKVIESTPERIVLTDGENEYRLAPAVAANVHVAPAPEHARDAGLMRLSDLGQGARAEVIALDDACQGYSRRRLMDLGFTEGAVIRPALQTFAGDPRAYEVRGTLVALRKTQASQILVRPREMAAMETR